MRQIKAQAKDKAKDTQCNITQISLHLLPQHRRYRTNALHLVGLDLERMVTRKHPNVLGVELLKRQNGGGGQWVLGRCVMPA